MLRRLAAKEQINLSKAQNGSRKPSSQDVIQLQLHDTTPIKCRLKAVMPVRIDLVKLRAVQANEYKSLIAQYHYLGFDMTEGENIKYMTYSRQGQLLTYLLKTFVEQNRFKGTCYKRVFMII